VVTVTQAYVYTLSRIVMDGAEMRVINWPTLFYSNVAVCEWREVQDVDVRKGGIFSQIFDYGTLFVQTAGTERNLRIPMIPNCEHWRDYIAQQADQAATPVQDIA
jgi:membrane protein YdbS with pleckstrin-like domain